MKSSYGTWFFSVVLMSLLFCGLADNFQWKKKSRSTDDVVVHAITVDSESKVWICGHFKTDLYFNTRHRLADYKNYYNVFIAKVAPFGEYESVWVAESAAHSYCTGIVAVGKDIYFAANLFGASPFTLRKNIGDEFVTQLHNPFTQQIFVEPRGTFSSLLGRIDQRGLQMRIVAENSLSFVNSTTINYDPTNNRLFMIGHYSEGTMFQQMPPEDSSGLFLATFDPRLLKLFLLHKVAYESQESGQLKLSHLVINNLNNSQMVLASGFIKGGAVSLTDSISLPTGGAVVAWQIFNEESVALQWTVPQKSGTLLVDSLGETFIAVGIKQKGNYSTLFLQEYSKQTPELLTETSFLVKTGSLTLGSLVIERSTGAIWVSGTYQRLTGNLSSPLAWHVGERVVVGPAAFVLKFTKTENSFVCVWADSLLPPIGFNKIFGGLMLLIDSKAVIVVDVKVSEASIHKALIVAAEDSTMVPVNLPPTVQPSEEIEEDTEESGEETYYSGEEYEDDTSTESEFSEDRNTVHSLQRRDILGKDKNDQKKVDEDLDESESESTDYEAEYEYHDSDKDEGEGESFTDEYSEYEKREDKKTKSKEKKPKKANEYEYDGEGESESVEDTEYAEQDEEDEEGEDEYEESPEAGEESDIEEENAEEEEKVAAVLAWGWGGKIMLATLGSIFGVLVMSAVVWYIKRSTNSQQLGSTAKFSPIAKV